jgi:16S rRNA (cytosine967-C5)-methyltransferase
LTAPDTPSRDGAAPRAGAARCIAAVAAGQTLENSLLAHEHAVAERDRALLRELCYGSLRAYPRLDALLRAMLRQPIRRREATLHALALVGLYQLSATRIPPHAAVSATVAATAALGYGRAQRGLLNALLRRYQREHSQLLGALSAAANAAQPAWLWDRLGEQWPAQRDQIAAASNAHPPLTLRVNRLQGSREAYVAELEAAGIGARSSRVAPDALVLESAVDVAQLPGFAAGRASVQDESAQLAAAILDPRPGEHILDACAAPGGKTGQLLEYLGGSGTVVAADVSDTRLDRVRDNLARLGLAATLLCADLTAAPAALREQAPFDAILLDVPCSATGVMRRHPDIKLLRRPADIAGFAVQQRDLLAASWALLRRGGRLLYVTCSVLREENQDVVEQFLQSQDDAAATPISLPVGVACPTGWQVLPQAGGGDGLYFALLEKR